MLSIVRSYWLLSTVLLAFAQTPEHKMEKIIGEEAQLEDYPFVVRLRVSQGILGEPRGWPCGGALVQPAWVLTSSVCVQIEHFNIGVAAGPTAVEARMGLKSGEPDQESRVAMIQSEMIYMHPRVQAREQHIVNDIALVRLKHAFTLSLTIDIIELTSTPLDYDSQVTMVGYSTITWWKTQDPNSPAGYMKLRSLTVPVWPQSKCDEQTDHAGQICIGEPIDMIWGYDLGGPLVYNKTVVGVTAPQMDRIYELGIFEDVFKHRDWIRSIIDIDLAPKKAISCVQRLKAIFTVYLYLFVIYLIKII